MWGVGALDVQAVGRWCWGLWENTLLPAKAGRGAIKAAEGGSRERGSVARHSLYRRNTFLSPNKAGALLWKRVPQSGNIDGLELWALRSPTRCTSVDSTLMLAIKMILFSASDESLEPIIFFGLIIWFQKDNLGRSNNSYCDTFDIDPTFPKQMSSNLVLTLKALHV